MRVLLTRGLRHPRNPQTLKPERTKFLKAQSASQKTFGQMPFFPRELDCKIAVVLNLVAEFISPQKVYTFSFIGVI